MLRQTTGKHGTTRGDACHLPEIDSGATIALNGGELAQIPEPATMSLLALGGVALLRRRRRR